MSVIRCKMCGGNLNIDEGSKICTCESCGTMQTLPRLDDERRLNLYDRANHFRRNNEFDKAMSIYETILNEDPDDAEAYWSLILCKYGIEYVEDSTTHKRIITCNRTQYTSIFADEDYKLALEKADDASRRLYVAEANEIDRIQKGILDISSKEEPFDVFICYKETDANGRRTQDSVLAQELYYNLTNEGYKVFFSRITLEDKLGSAYEPYIFAALNSAKVMVVVTTRPDYVNSPWVKNEWGRYLSIIKQDNRQDCKKVLIPAYRDMDPYDLPEEFSHLQAQDMSKLGFMQDLVRGIKKIITTNEPKVTVKETVVTAQAPANIAPLLKRAYLFIEDGEWEQADEYCEKILDQDPEYAEAYVGKLMVDLQCRKQADLASCDHPFDTNKYYQKAVRFADETLKASLNSYNDAIRERNRQKAEEERKNSLYFEAIKDLQSNSISRVQRALEVLQSLNGWKESEKFIKQCEEQMEQLRAKKIAAEQAELERRRKEELDKIEEEKLAKEYRKISIIILSIVTAIIAFLFVLNLVIKPNSKYNKAVSLMNDGKYDKAISMFIDLGEFKDSNAKLKYCYSIKYDADESQIATNVDMPFLQTKNGGISSISKYNLPSDLTIPAVFNGELVTSISTNAFHGCSSLTSITIPNSVTSIGDYAFFGCSSLTNITIPNSITSISDFAFHGCSSLTNITIPNSVTSISDFAFHGCSSLTNITIPNSVTSIGNSAFDDCDNLASITIPNSVTSIGDEAFYDCNSLTSITIPNSVTSIGESAFGYCTSLKNTTYNGTKEQWNNINKGSSVFYMQAHASSTVLTEID